MATKKSNWGFDTKAMDHSVRPQDDFHHYASGTWLKKTKIPETESRWGSFSILQLRTLEQVHAIVEELSEKNHARGSVEQLIGDLYRSGMDMKVRNAHGAKPVEPYLNTITRVATREELYALLPKLHEVGITAPWGYMVDQDSKNSERYALHFFQSGLGMPDRDYYLKNDGEFLRVRAAYEPYVARMFVLAGWSESDAERAARTVLKIETKLARISMHKVDARDAEKTYHKVTFAKLAQMFRPLNARTYFAALKMPRVPYAIVMQPKFLAASTKLLATLPLDEWKTYFMWQCIEDAAPYLSQDFVDAHFYFNGTILSGNTKIKPLWRRTLAVVSGTLGHAVGKMYVKKHFGAEAHRKMETLVKDLFAAYERRIKGLDWMSDGTKKRAITKLHQMKQKIGYPKKWRSYKGLKIESDDYFGNLTRATLFAERRALKKLRRKKVDRTEWFMSPQTVNAYCSFSMNEIVFPAAILQPPFFNGAADDAVNYGAIGSVIGHEMTHGFDDQGSKFDGLGNMHEWWTAQDRKRFMRKAQTLVKQYNNFVVANGVHVNGKLILGENIADLGGVVIAFDALQAHLKKVGKKIIGGYTPEQRFFLGFAQQERELSRPEFEKTAALNDPHAPSFTRINGPLANVAAFYEAFNVQPGDKLYRAPKDRAEIW